MKDELDGDIITEFVTGGAKNYGYKNDFWLDLERQHFPSTAYCLEVIELPYGQFEFKLICMVSPL